MQFIDNGQQAIVDAAVGTDFYERTRFFRGDAEVRLGAELLDHLRTRGGLTFEAIRYTTTIRNYRLANVVLDTDTLVLIKDGLAIPETAYFASVGKADGSAIDGAELISGTANEDVVVGYNNVHQGYQHWLTQCLPAIDWSLRQRRSRPVRLLLPALQPWQEDLLQLLGHAAVPRLIPEAGKKYHFKQIEYSEYLNGSASFSVCLTTLETARRIANAVPPVQSIHKMIYVPCPHPWYGSIANEVEVIAMLRGKGVYILDQTLVGTAARINLFRNADLVIGQHGEGLSDVLFCQPGAVLWEWMPEHSQNPSFNRLAQAAQVHYRGDLFSSATENGRPGDWIVDLERVDHQLAQLISIATIDAAGLPRKQPLTRGDHKSAGTSNTSYVPKPIDELLLAFESLGDTCEFGLVQRHAGIEPLGLLRFAGIMGPGEQRIGRLVNALERRFDGLGTIGTIEPYLEQGHGRREFMARESVYNLQYHTGMYSGEIAPDQLKLNEVKRLGFLRRKLIEDLQAGEKIWVWQSAGTTSRDQVQPLLDVLRAIGPNTLLWVVEGDVHHPPGTAERLEPDFLKGYIEHFDSNITALELSAFSWIVVCQQAYELRYPTPIQAPVADHVETPVPSAHIPSAMEFLSRNQPSIETGSVARPARGRLARIFGMVGRHLGRT